MENIIRIIYCKDCQKDIPIEELVDGTIVVRCPRCIGECIICDCHLVKECFPDTPHVRVRHPDDGQEIAS